MAGARHKTLDPRTNKVLAVTWFCASAVLLFLFPSPHAHIAAIVSGGAGIVCGGLQRRAIRANPRELFHAASALAVRRALTAVPAGTWSIRILWARAAAVFVLALSGPLQDFAPVVFVGIFAFMFAREVVSHRALVWLQSYEPGPTTEANGS